MELFGVLAVIRAVEAVEGLAVLGPPEQGLAVHILLFFSYICHRHKNQVRIEMKRFGAFVVFGVLAWMLVDMQMNYGSSSVHAHWFSHWKIRADDHDIRI